MKNKTKKTISKFVKRKKSRLWLQLISIILILAIIVGAIIFLNQNSGKIPSDDDTTSPIVPENPTNPPENPTIPEISDETRKTSFLGGNATIKLPSKINVKKDDAFSLFEVHFIDVGQGDGILIRCPDGADILIDAGSGTVNPSAENTNLRILDYLKSVNLDKIDYLIASHSDSDHINMLDNVLDEYVVDNIFYNKIDTNATKTALLFDQKAKSEKNSNNELAKVEIFDEDGDIYTIAESNPNPRYKMTIIAPGFSRFSDVNSSSPIIIMEMFDRKLVLTGDAHIDTEEYFIETYTTAYSQTLDCDFLKVGHHGSESSTSQEFLSFIKCEFAVISAGIDNKYDHPRDLILNRLKTNKMETYITAKQGQTVLYVDYENDFAFGIQKGVPPLYPINNDNYFFYQAVA